MLVQKAAGPSSPHPRSGRGLPSPFDESHGRARGASISAVFCILGGIAASCIVGCSTPAPRKPIEMQPIGTVPNIPRTVDEGDSGTTTTPNSGTPVGGVGNARETPCTGAEFEATSDLFKTCEVSSPKSGEAGSGFRDKLEIRAAPSAPTVPPGGRVDVTVTLRNKSHDLLPLFLTGDPNPNFEIEALDARGRRVDLPTGKPPKGMSTPSREQRAVRITLTPGGTLRARIVWEAVKTKFAPEKAKTWEGRGPARSPAGPLPPGKYTLRLALPLVGVFDKGELDVPRLPMEVAP